MEIRRPNVEGYKVGNLSPNVKFTKELKIKEGEKRPSKEFTSSLEKMRSEMWFPNKDITTIHIKNEIKKIEGIRVVKYSKDDEDKEKLIIFFHGGGYYGGSTDTIQNTCRYMAEQTGATVISVDYSLAPEFPYPTSINEGYTVLKYFENRYDSIYVGGDSAGGGLACSVVIKDIEEGTKICDGLIMYYPVLLIDLKDNCREDFVWDIKEYDIDETSPDAGLMKSEASGLKYAMSYIKDMYIKTNESIDNYYISQINAPDSLLRQFPKTLIFTVEYDYLRLEAEYFHKRLRENAVKSIGIRYAGEVHAFIDKTGFNDNIIDSVDEIREFIK
ncbi:alpha/beta hydrolase fold domain-containing protein [Streptobacillus felis]|uniref:Alpha/beta hydrolase fold domain-containing protein n=1 Tax=Streptobacillus felis TaxID=1384509 RepID=A0A7Z0PG33_9FUSO|nr:alpha/beta hydrolase fold domain-containing protein [Streptobacillus felis]NYV28409.1 alpha/beta hydrolase fold domain-containing protein [Streptobacillus felis]